MTKGAGGGGRGGRGGRGGGSSSDPRAEATRRYGSAEDMRNMGELDLLGIRNALLNNRNLDNTPALLVSLGRVNTELERRGYKKDFEARF